MRNYIILFLLFMLCACQLTLEVDLPPHEESIVVNSLFAADSLWGVSVFYDHQILDDTPFKPVENAEVVIYDESGPVETLTLNKQKYYRAATSKPVPGKRYEIRVSAPGRDPVSAFTSVPHATEIVGVKTRETFMENEPATAWDITIKDDPLVENFYRVFVTIETYYFNSQMKTLTPIYRRVYLESDDPLLDDENNLSENGVLINDVIFNGKEARLSVKMWGSLERNMTQGKIRVNVQTLSKEAYDYLITSELQRNTTDDPFAQPVNVFNNIEGGFGIFAGYNQTTLYADGPPGPIITNITPMSGNIYDEVIIEGSNFSINPWETAYVIFSGEDYPVASNIESTATRIKVQVPFGAVTGPITILARGQLVTSKEDFVVNN
jgi:hypothetical protein